MPHRVTLLQTVQLTPDTKSYVFTRPDGYTFTPGQATDLALTDPEWADEQRPFTFTGHPNARVLSFVIKSYFDHDGVTKQLWSLDPGDEVEIGAPWGAFKTAGPGVFVAGGAGITPFIPIIDALARSDDLSGSKLIFANHRFRDIILRDHFEGYQGLECHFVTQDGEQADAAGRLDGDVLGQAIADFDGTFYVCGPPPMMESVLSFLHDKGVKDDQILQEE